MSMTIGGKTASSIRYYKCFLEIKFLEPSIHYPGYRKLNPSNSIHIGKHTTCHSTLVTSYICTFPDNLVPVETQIHPGIRIAVVAKRELDVVARRLPDLRAPLAVVIPRGALQLGTGPVHVQEPDRPRSVGEGIPVDDGQVHPCPPVDGHLHLVLVVVGLRRVR